MLLQLFLTLLFAPFCFSLNQDGLALLALKAAISTDPTRSLDSWSDSDSTPCHWTGIHCIRNRVTSLYLPNKSFTGYMPSELGLLNSLTRLNLAHNNFSKPIPANLFNATNLVYLDLSHNSFSGTIPDQIKTLKDLTHLDLSSNHLNGSLPEFLLDLRGLTGTLNLSYNQFSGQIPEMYGHFPVMVSLDLRYNNLSGEIPQVGSLLNQGPTAFAGNPRLCGFPLQSPCPEAENHGAFSNPEEERDPQDPKSSSSSYGVEEKEKEERNTGSVAVSVISGVSVVVGVFVSVLLFRRKRRAREGKMGKENKCGDVAVDEEEGQNGKFVVMDEGSGIVYKVIAGRGSAVIAPAVVAVRRLSEGDNRWRLKEFEAEVEAIGRVQHPNIVRLKAYYYANDEKLLISDFVRNGSLYTALHGGPSNSLPPLSWAAKLKIAQGTARGLMYIHEHSPRKYVHGNIKSTKILLDGELRPHISGFGITRLVPGTSKMTKNQTIAIGSRFSAHATVYLAPEARIYGSKFTQKCDVYSFGIVLLELLTGRLPDAGPDNDDPALLTEVHAKKQVIATFHIALNCTELDPEVRPRMRTVSENLDRIKSQ
ncbi:hypothetical protein Patl1_20619 [Pistacia atlantica]|uniref:Uncharacterized protein n=1 Tax=Pistacia atlantica TaxID=434234 RepID=A0ACC1BLY9_9ROSI|nr:hypothetical protein Patl1_20619 [Pistacia atlantica]